MNYSVLRGINLMLLIAALEFVAGCGGGGGGGEVTPQPPTAPTKAAIAYTVQNSSGYPLAGVQFSAYLPAGADVALEPGTHNVAATNLVAGSALSGVQVNIFATYSAPIRKLKFAVAAANTQALQSGFAGEVLKVTCTLAQGTKLAVNDFNSANSGRPITELVGYRYDQLSQNSVDISNSLTPLLSVLLY